MADLGLAVAPDEWIIEHTNDLTAALWFLSQHAIDHGDVALAHAALLVVTSGDPAESTARPARRSTANFVP